MRRYRILFNEILLTDCNDDLNFESDADNSAISTILNAENNAVSYFSRAMVFELMTTREKCSLCTYGFGCWRLLNFNDTKIVPSCYDDGKPNEQWVCMSTLLLALQEEIALLWKGTWRFADVQLWFTFQTNLNGNDLKLEVTCRFHDYENHNKCENQALLLGKVASSLKLYSRMSRIFIQTRAKIM